MMSDATTTIAADAAAAASGATDFQRTRSKVWFPCADDDYDDVDDAAGHRRPHGSPWRRRQPSTSPDSCRRVSSGSPSNGSHRSQDSGFSDSESGGGGGGNSPPGPSNGDVRPRQSAADRLPDDERSAAEKVCCGPAVVAALEPPCDCFLPACELSRKFRSYEHVAAAAAAAASPPFIKHPGAADLQRSSSPQPPSRTPNRTCFIVDELPKSPKATAAAVVVGSDGSLPSPPSQATPSSVKSFDGNFDRSTNVTVVENFVVADDGSSQRDHHPIIEPPAPFDDDRHDFSDASDNGPNGPPVHASTPKSAKTRCCTPGPRRGKELQLRKAEPDTYDRAERENEVPVGQWLNELRFRCELECMTTLQSKSIATSEEASRRLSAIVVCPDSGVVRDLYHRTKVISNEFQKVYNDLNHCRLDNFGPSVQTLTGLLMDFVSDHQRELPEHGQELCMDLVDVSEKLRIHANRRLGNRKVVLNDVSGLGQIFSELVDALLLKKIQMLVNALDEPGTDAELIKAMSGIDGLGLEPIHLGSLVAKCNGVRSLLTVCIDASSSAVRSSALRTLAVVCGSSDSVGQFEKAGGIEILADILSSRNRPERELTDAVSVLTQITSPWIEDNRAVNGLREYLDTIVSSLTDLVESTRSEETLLLSAAALANMTGLEPDATWAALNANTAGTLVEAVRRRGAGSSVFLREQTAAVLANMAVVPEARPRMAANHAVVALLCFLQVRHSPLQRVPEILAAERLQHKTAIALSRLCSDVEVSKQVVELEGVNRLIRLCKDERERNHSDGVLVACLASLRKIAANCGKHIMNPYDAAELIEPRLLDSFLLYSSKQESYV